MNSESLYSFDQNGQRKLCIRAADGARADIYRHGAHVTSWHPASQYGDEERLFLSSAALFNGQAAIRGGVPIIFPQFADFGPLSKHGFARSIAWQLVSCGNGPTASALYRLEDSEQTRAGWPFKFNAEYQVRVGGARLQLSLCISNTDAQPFSFTAALHTYLRVNDIADVTLHGLQGLRYRDSAAGGAEKQETLSETHINGEVDRIYYSAQQPVVVREPLQRMRVEMQGFSDVVVWNPGAEKGAALSDLEAEGYRRMLCIEAAVIREPVTIAPGESWVGVQMLACDEL